MPTKHFWCGWPRPAWMCLLPILLFLAPHGIADSYHAIPFFPAASDPLGRQGFARIVNLSDSAGTVSIVAFDDGGRRHGPVTLSLDARQTRHLNSGDLEDGAASKGLPQGTGAPTSGDWRLELSSELNLNVLSYIRTSDGFVTSMHDVAASESETHHVPFFNPASNYRQESLLRLVNPRDRAVNVTIRATDDLGAASRDSVRLKLAPYGASSVSATDLEDGASGLDGSLGNGEGKWRLAISADSAITVMSLLSTPTGHLTNLSTDPGGVPSIYGCIAPESGGGGGNGGNPDLVVDCFYVHERRLDAPGKVFDITAIVRNRGEGRSLATTLVLASSSSTGFRFGGTQENEVPVDSLAAGATSSVKTVSLTAPSQAGVWYYRACAEVVPGESGSERDNNCSELISVSVLPPDLVVEGFDVVTREVGVSAEFDVTAVVRNRGEGQSTATELAVRSADVPNPRFPDTEVKVPVDRLAAGATSSVKTVSVTAPSNAGSHYYAVCVDAVSGETGSERDNNCSDWVGVDVLE